MSCSASTRKSTAPLKTVGAAAVLRTHLLSQMEKAEDCDDPARRRWYLSFLVVGGGYSGVETAGEINDLVRTTPEHPAGEVIATLGTGSFFGEQALLNNRPRSASVRARTTAEIVIMGRNVFSTISQSLAPLKQALTQAITRRSASF